MRLPLVLLAIGSAVVGFIDIPHILQPVFRLPADAAAPRRCCVPVAGHRWRR